MATNLSNLRQHGERWLSDTALTAAEIGAIVTEITTNAVHVIAIANAIANNATAIQAIATGLAGDATAILTIANGIANDGPSIIAIADGIVANATAIANLTAGVVANTTYVAVSQQTPGFNTFPELSVTKLGTTVTYTFDYPVYIAKDEISALGANATLTYQGTADNISLAFTSATWYQMAWILFNPIQPGGLAALTGTNVQTWSTGNLNTNPGIGTGNFESIVTVGPNATRASTTPVIFVGMDGADTQWPFYATYSSEVMTLTPYRRTAGFSTAGANFYNFTPFMLMGAYVT